MELLPEFCQIYILYLDVAKGLIPILIFSNSFIKKNEKQILPIKFHPILLLDSEKEKDFQQINLIYNGKVYCAKRFNNKITNENSGKLFIVLVLPKDYNIYGSDLLDLTTNTIKKNFGDSLNQIIESEILKENSVKPPRIVEIIKKGESIKANIKKYLKRIWEDYFESKTYSFEKNQPNIKFEEVM
ncbi:MAG: hypothetical protein ACFFE5_07890 [Candidatus Thorarchaeota archaeon]